MDHSYFMFVWSVSFVIHHDEVLTQQILIPWLAQTTTSSSAPSNGYKENTLCGGIRKSPININTSDIEERSFVPFVFKGFNDTKNYNLTMENAGKTVLVNIDSTIDVLVTGGDLTPSYKAEYIQFYWGDDANDGVQHLLDGVRYTLEMQLSTYNTKYKDMDEALKHSDGISVLVFLFIEIPERENDPRFEALNNGLDKIKFKGQQVNFARGDYNLLSLVSDIQRQPRFYFRYAGKTPASRCEGNVTWSVFQPLTSLVSQLTIDKFRAISDNKEAEIFYSRQSKYRLVPKLTDSTVYVYI